MDPEEEVTATDRARRLYNYTVVSLYIVLIGANVLYAIDQATEGELGRWWDTRRTGWREHVRGRLEARRNERAIRRVVPEVVFEAIMAKDGLLP